MIDFQVMINIHYVLVFSFVCTYVAIYISIFKLLLTFAKIIDLIQYIPLRRDWIFILALPWYVILIDTVLIKALSNNHQSKGKGF